MLTTSLIPTNNPASRYRIIGHGPNNYREEFVTPHLYKRELRKLENKYINPITHQPVTDMGVSVYSLDAHEVVTTYWFTEPVERIEVQPISEVEERHPEQRMPHKAGVPGQTTLKDVSIAARKWIRSTEYAAGLTH